MNRKRSFSSFGFGVNRFVSVAKEIRGELKFVHGRRVVRISSFDYRRRIRSFVRSFVISSFVRIVQFVSRYARSQSYCSQFGIRGRSQRV